MGASPIVPNTPNVDKQVITIPFAITSGGAAQEDDATAPTYAPKIDIREGRPALSAIYLPTEGAAANSDIEFFYPNNLMPRATPADSSGEWRVKDKSTVSVYHAADLDGAIVVTYIAFGSQQA